MTATARLNRLFAADGRCLDVAIDHGIFGELSFLKGLEDVEGAVLTLVDANPDAIQLSPGQAPVLQSIPGKGKPALVMRADVTNVYGGQSAGYLFDQLIDDAVECAVRLDAACVVANVLLVPEEPELYHACLTNVIELKRDCEHYGMPLMVEPLAMKASETTAGFTVDGDAAKIVPLVRQVIELGADVIKADPTDDLEAYTEVIQAAGGRPVLVRGGGRASEADLLRRTYEVMQLGASGIVYGRNIVQHEYPDAITRALMEIVHDDATPEDAMRTIDGARGSGTTF